jgi:plastocyanin
MKLKSGLAAAVGLVFLASACAQSGAGGREVAITQANAGCSPASVSVQPGEKLQFVVKNDSDRDVYELEGIEGTKLEEFAVPGGRTRRVGYTVPGAANGTYKLKCYVPAGPTTIIELVAGEGGAVTSGEAGAKAVGGVSGPADDSVIVEMGDYYVTPDKPSVKAGRIQFVAKNVSDELVHELAVLKKLGEGKFDNAGEIENLAPGGGGGEITLELEPGEYELACLVAAGEFGSPVDHYKAGQKIAFAVTE